MRRQFLELGSLEVDLSVVDLPVIGSASNLRDHLRDIELGEPKEVILYERTMKASEFVVFDKMPIFPVDPTTVNEGWINLLVDGKKFFEKGFPLNYIGRWTYLISDFIAYVFPGQKFAWTFMPRVGDMELLIPYMFMDGVDAIYALRLVDLGIVVNMSNVNWYRRTIIEGRNEEEIVREAGQRILIDQMRHRFDYNFSDFDMIDDGDGIERGFRRLHIRSGEE